jgi:PAS domain S-box-containing protein
MSTNQAYPAHNLKGSGPEKKGSKSIQIQSPVKLILIIAAANFITEFAVMIILRFVQTDSFLVDIVLDSGLLLLFLAPVLIKFGLKPMEQQIDQRQKAEKELGESERRLRMALHAAPVVLFNQDRELRYTWAYNDDRELGYLIGKNDSEMYLPDEIERVAAIKQKVIREGIGARYEAAMQLHNHARYYDFSVEPLLGDDGQVVGITSAAMDITERKRTEQMLKQYQENLEALVSDRTAKLKAAVVRLERQIGERKRAEEALKESQERSRQLFEQTEDAIFLFQAGTCTIVDSNPRAEKMYGYTKEEFAGLGPSCFVPGQDLEKLCSIIRGLEKTAQFSIENMAHIRKNGARLNASLRGKMITIQGRDLVYCTVRDITERVRMEEEARAVQSKLIHANKMASLGVLMSGIAHEVNNPNNFIMSNAELLSRSWKDLYPILEGYHEEHGEFIAGGVPFSELRRSMPEIVTGIIDGSRRIRDIIQNMKNLARDDKSCLDGSIDLNSVVRLSVSLLSHQIKKYTHRFHLDLADGLPVIKGCSQQLEQVMINLMINAMQALPDKQRGIWISTTGEPDSDQVIAMVRDEGVGIPSGIVHRVMEPFFTTKFDTGGTGLGLSISNLIIREHGGVLELHSRPGEGTTFIIKLPAIRNREASS